MITYSCRRLYALIVVVLVCTLVLAPCYYQFHGAPPPSFVGTIESKRPSTWAWLKKWEAELPQHNLTISATVRFVKFSTQAQGLGWNNILAELLVNAHIAHESGRGYVFPDYTWEGKHYPFPEALARQWPPHTPLNALISGPIAGGPWDASDDTPRSISSEWFDVVCPPSERLTITSDMLKNNLSNKDGLTMLRGYARILRDTPERCVEVVPSPTDNFPQLFDVWIWGESRLLSLWDTFSISPVSTLLQPSHIVRAAVDRNAYLFLPQGPSYKSVVSESKHKHTVTRADGTPSLSDLKRPYRDYDRVLAIHLRRGDFEGACKHFATWSSRFNGWNQLEFLPDRLSVPQDEEDRMEMYRMRCSPTSEEIVAKVMNTRDEFQDAAGNLKGMVLLDTVYIMTNEQRDSDWIKLVIEALKKEGWENVVTSLDLHHDTVEQEEVGMAIDMEIARLSAVFVGNGWSSFTSNIVHRRLVDQRPPISLRFY